MKLLRSDFDLDQFFHDLGRAPQRLLLLDYDGTLAPLRRERDQAVPYPGVAERLAALAATAGTRLAVVSGRPAEEVEGLLGMRPAPEIWGCHGLERLRPGRALERDAVAPATRRALDAAEAWARERGLAPHLERKPASLALHWRGLDAAEIASLTRAAIAAWPRGDGLAIQPFDGGLELRAAGVDKGRAVAALLAESPPDAAVAFLGDDRTDEDAFAALPPGGLAVLARSRLRPTRAQLWLRPPEELLEFLERWREAERGAA